MSSAGLIVSLIIISAGVVWVLFPILQQAKRKGGEVTRERDELLTRYERVLSAIRDLDEDFQVGKLDATAHHEERTRWSQRGVEVLQKLEAVDGTTGAARELSPITENLSADDELEALIARYVKTKSVS